jgi:hypothetical protein
VSDAKLGAGFRYSKIMAWSPAILVALALVTMVAGAVWVGLAILAFAVLMLFYVQRRRKAEAGGGPAGTP